MRPIVKILEAVIDGADATAIDSDTVLESIPGWDSMNAINFLLELEVDYAVDLSGLDLSQLATFGQICDYLRTAGVPADALLTQKVS